MTFSWAKGRALGAGRDFLGLLAVAMVFAVVRNYPPVTWVHPEAQGAMHLGFMLLMAYFLGRVMSRLGLPQQVGFLVAGALLGPFATGAFSTVDIQSVKFINDLALAFIALGAGLHLDTRRLWARRKALGVLVALVPVAVFLATFAGVWLLAEAIPLLAQATPALRLAMTLTLATLAATVSPASTIGVVTETRAQGPLTQSILSMVVLIDLGLIVFFASLLGFFPLLLGEGPTGDKQAWLVVAELVGSVAQGWALGWVVARMFRAGNTNAGLALVGLAFIVTRASNETSHLLATQFNFAFHLEPLITSIATGVYLKNRFARPWIFEQPMNQASLLIFALFFALAGATMRLDVVVRLWPLVMALAVWRMLSLMVAAPVAARLAGEPRPFWGLYGPGLIAQSGVSIGLVLSFTHRFPGWGQELGAVMLAVIAINELIGPAVLNGVLGRAGEIPPAHTPASAMPAPEHASKHGPTPEPGPNP